VEVEFQLDAAALAAAAGKDLNSDDYKGKKWEIGETTENSELRFQVRVPVDKREGLTKKEHVSNKAEVRVIKKAMRVLLWAAGANRDYQFIRTLLVRETEKKRVDLAVHLQLPPGSTVWRTGVVQDVPPERLLTRFPDTFGGKGGGDIYDLASYDVIIAFDPDWNRLSAEQVKLLANWVGKGGGFVYIGGHINTVELIRPHEGTEEKKFDPLLKILPVVLDDRRDYLERNTDDPWALNFDGATPEMEFLRLDEELDETKFKEDWNAFFYGVGKEKTDTAQRGFYNFYPVQKAKTGSIVIARFTDPKTKLKDTTLHPFIVMSPDPERVIWIGSAETWRLREYREAYHERFWTKLVRFAGAKSQGTINRRIRLEMGKFFPANQPIPVEAKLDGASGEPLERTSKPEITLKFPPGADEKTIRLPVIMSPRAGTRDGWFTARFPLKAPGEYELHLKVPETGDTAMQKFTVRAANPELDNTRPDFARMYRLASEADEVLLRMGETAQQELKKRLKRPDFKKDDDLPSEADKVELSDKMRLYFDLKNADLIPSCMIQDVQKQTSRGPVSDKWDGGWTMWMHKGEPVRMSYVLTAVVALLSLEWLIRKLLRLA
jgi:hypothetical protein